jgi:hypothetical protein
MRLSSVSNFQHDSLPELSVIAEEKHQNELTESIGMHRYFFLLLFS